MGDVCLKAIDGSSPLGFLAALGVLRLAGSGNSRARLRWARAAGFWRPWLEGCGGEPDVVDLLLQARWAPVAELISLMGKNITVAPESFAKLAARAVQQAREGERGLGDFASAFSFEGCDDPKKGRIQYTDFCFITGSGHQDFLGTMEKLAQSVTREHLQDALFGEWKTDDGLSMRWDPCDAAEYALRWDDPGPKGARAVWGANRLACEALPLFPTVPGKKRLVTTGFRWAGGTTEFTWPLWESGAGVDTARSLLSRGELVAERPDRDRLAAIGIAEIYRARRVRIGQGGHFKVSFREAGPV